MEGSKKGESPSKSRKSPSPKPSSAGENNENDSIQNQMNPNLQSQKKVGVKHFMSPTISAASKAAIPRKKILADSNENSVSSGAQIQDNFNLDSKRISRKPSSHSNRSSTRVVSSFSHASESDDDIDSLANSSSKPYDPLTNYLSPRPKYLRFNPNRRHVILTRPEKEDLDGSFESQDEEEESNEDVGNREIEDWDKNDGSEGETDEEDEEEEEEEEEEVEGKRGWCLGVIKVLFTVIACLLWTSCMCSMNSTSPSQVQQAIWDLKGGYLRIQKQTLEVIATKMHETGFLAVEEGDSYQELDEIEIDEIDEMDNEESIEVEMVENREVSLEAHKEELVHDVNEDEADKIDEAEETKGVGAGEFEVKGENFAQLVESNTDESRDTDSNRLEKELETSNLGYNEDGADKMEAEENKVVGGGEAEFETDDESSGAGNSELEKEADDSNHLQELELSGKFDSDQEDGEAPKDPAVLDSIESSEELIESHEKSAVSVDEVHEIGYDNGGQMEKSGWKTAIIGVSLVAISLVASLAVFFYRSKKARSTSAGQSQSVVKPPQSNVEDKLTPKLLAMDEKRVSSSKPLSMSFKEEAPEELNQRIHVPTAELVGEIVIGNVSSSAGVYGRKSKMSEFQETSNVTIFAKQGSPPQPVTTPNQPSTLNVSYTTSDSHGSFTAERKISKKEGSNSGKAMAEVTTPLRRSSRLRSRAAVMSP